MSLPKIILVPTDFGEPSDCAMRYAVDLAKSINAEIVLMHSYELPIVGFPDGAIVATAELASRVVDGAQTGLNKQVKLYASSGVKIRGLIKQGDPFAMVNEAAEETGAELIIMGTHGRTGLPRMLIGSVAEKVVRTAKLPVLTVHPDDIKGVPDDMVPSTQVAAPISNGVVSSDHAAPSHR